MFCLFTLLIWPNLLNAQVENGINGTVFDASGSVIVGASVTVTNQFTEVVSQAKTSSAGTFTVVGLPPGEYTVAVDAHGFEQTKTVMAVEVAKMAGVSFRMVPGATTETVTVKEDTITLDTESPGIGTTLEPELVKTALVEINGLARKIDSFMYTLLAYRGMPVPTLSTAASTMKAKFNSMVFRWRLWTAPVSDE